MAEQAEKGKCNRYPMGTVKQARRTLHRLTLDLMGGKLDAQKYRAAVYGLATLSGLFRLETPEKPDVLLIPSCRNESYEERQKQLEELLPGYHEFQKQREEERQMAAERETDEIIKNAVAYYNKNHALNEDGNSIEKSESQPPETAAVLPGEHKCGIGARR